MDWLRTLAALAVTSLTFVAVGGLVVAAQTAAANLAVLVVLALLAVAVLAGSSWGSAATRRLSNPYWGG